MFWFYRKNRPAFGNPLERKGPTQFPSPHSTNSMTPNRSGVWKLARPGGDQALSSRSTSGGRSMRQKFARHLAPARGGSATRLRKGIASSAHQPAAVRRAAVRKPSQRQAKSF